ncbi:hypothetical protein KUTeg_024131 [Tegillarca granosa]|uniref:Ankyrin repeat domain-containing protein 10 n=1 Tax=Tegillarca granosa TaxID=220873 RepID=A0ABQ9E256_TEGGR|nr:hypothetical protein KUTeg_024131 [Tegillarca granosa]
MEEINEMGYYSEDGQDLLHDQFPLHRASRDGDLETLTKLLSSGNCDFYEEDYVNGWTPVHWAAFSGKLNCLMRMTEHGANCDASTSRLNQAPTHIAAFWGKGHCLKWLLHCGSLINRQLECIRKLSLTNQCVDKASSRSGQTPVHLSAYYDHPHCIQWLLQYGVCVDCQDFLGETPIHKSARSGSMECVSLLVSQGATLSLRNHSGKTPSQVAMECGYQECANYLERAMQIQQKATGVYDGIGTPVTQPSSNIQSLSDIKTPAPQGMNGSLVPENENNDIDNCDMEMDDPSTYKIVNGIIDTGCYGHKINGLNILPNGHTNGLSHLYSNGHVNGESYCISGGRRKRSCDDLEEESIKRCRVGASDSNFSEADSYNNNIVSSYHAILSISTNPRAAYRAAHHLCPFLFDKDQSSEVNNNNSNTLVCDVPDLNSNHRIPTDIQQRLAFFNAQLTNQSKTEFVHQNKQNHLAVKANLPIEMCTSTDLQRLTNMHRTIIT